MKLTPRQIQPAITSFLAEDLGRGDLSTLTLPHRQVTGEIVARQAGVIAGQLIPSVVLQSLNRDSHYEQLVADGAWVTAGTVTGRVTAPIVDLLAGERVLLNLMQRMSGIATATHAAVEELNDASIAILDTRKTLPGLRQFDKAAVVIGGGQNHRFGLDDAVMIKDNHWALIEDLPTTVQQLRRQIGPTKIIEIEVETETQLRAAVASQVEMIMIDNQTPATVRAWRQLIPATIMVEVSGGITPATLAQYAHTGVDYISLGYLTHSVTALDLAMEIEPV
ncbi:carboxylating nicotinate-nucleotide diphosphorylase [Lactiplantibacillus sp. WILCCON 0030]|uniref:nicotinate-nucleotide diphosphorylase (carboxylating) n=1 Tax=Lactiplantibacillus brownii TaxID=3069269 RepID=A0ABU1A752_9LACO|nr:carboxylating nicotinate-nucleotide diphosphorylase [Lactiplantibacillus brownii]MDQ7936758.1 carboxylating nicotinate-nucleotide diphosphorylase [Lactiplantibacillus brownii]